MSDYEQPVNDPQDAPEYDGTFCPSCGDEEIEREDYSQMTDREALEAIRAWTESYDGTRESLEDLRHYIREILEAVGVKTGLRG